MDVSWKSACGVFPAEVRLTANRSRDASLPRDVIGMSINFQDIINSDWDTAIRKLLVFLGMVFL
jgi:hypothetical protein